MIVQFSTGAVAATLPRGERALPPARHGVAIDRSVNFPSIIYRTIQA